MIAGIQPVLDMCKDGARPAYQRLREIPVRAEVRKSESGSGPLAVFLPAYGRVGAARLRIFSMAEALRPFGWRTLVLPPELTLIQRQMFLKRLKP